MKERIEKFLKNKFGNDSVVCSQEEAVKYILGLIRSNSNAGFTDQVITETIIHMSKLERIKELGAEYKAIDVERDNLLEKMNEVKREVRELYTQVRLQYLKEIVPSELKEGDYLVSRNHLYRERFEAYQVSELYPAGCTVSCGDGSCMSDKYEKFYLLTNPDLANVLYESGYFEDRRS